MERVASKSRKPKNKDPLPFLRKATTKFPFESSTSTGGQASKIGALGPMDKIFQKERWEELDFTIAFFFYENFISFNVACSPLFIEMCRVLTQGAPTGYEPPGSEKLRTTLLTKAKKEVQKMLEPIVASWPTSGVSIVSNGWTDLARHPIINFMVSSLSGPVFMKVVDTLGEYKDAQFIGELFIKVIKDVGVDSCVQIIIDNTPVCKVASMIAKAKYPQVFWTPCIVHSLNVALKSIASDVLWIGSIIEDARHIRNFVQNHTNALTIYKEYTNLSLFKIVDTQFASSFMMLKRLREVKTALGAMVISKFWSSWRKTDQVASKRVKDTVLDDAWWERVDLIIRIIDTIISLLRLANTDKPILGEVYEGWDSMIESVRSIILQSECPEFYPHMDGEISQRRKEAFRQIFQDSALLAEVEDAFAEFSTGSGRFGGYDVIRDRGAKKAYSWWANHGAINPPLLQLAMRLLPQVTSSSCCERNWSTCGNLYSVKKSRLEQSRAEIMVYVHTNLRLIYRQREEWLKGKTKMSDVFPNDMGLDTSVELALANMDLNDPVLEPVRFDDLEGSSFTPADAEATMDT
eukprot:PITA_22236